MELYDAMRTNPSCRYFTDEPVPDQALHRILDHARFASSGGNRQGWRVLVATDPEVRARIAELHNRQWAPYYDHAREGVVGYQGGDGEHRMAEQGLLRRLQRTDDFAKSLAEVPVLMVVFVDLTTLAVTDRDLDRDSVVGGGSVYTLVQNILLGCRAEGLGSALTTLLCAEEPAVRELFDIPEDYAVAALLAIGWPMPERQYTKLTRKPVEEIAYRNAWGDPFEC